VFNRQAYDIAQKRIERDDTVMSGDTVLLIIILGGLGAVEGCNAFLASEITCRHMYLYHSKLIQTDDSQLRFLR
jgi:hypothetical protein